MFKSKNNSPLDFVGIPKSAPPRARRKRNRAAESLRRKAREFQQQLYARAAALHGAADALQQDDEEARCNPDVPSTCIPRVRARQIEAIADRLFSAVCGK